LAQATLCYRETQFPLPKRGQSPQFLAHVYCSQTAGWIKMPLGMEAWRIGNIVGRINEVTLRRARLVLRWVTVFGG